MINNILDKYISKENKEVVVEFKNLVLLILTIIDLVFILLTSFYRMPLNTLNVMAKFDLLVCSLLFLNIISEYENSEESLITFIKGHIIDLIALIPYEFIFLRYFALLRVFRLIQLIKFFNIFKFSRYSTESIKYFIQNRLLKVLLFIIIFYVIITSLILYYIDPTFSSTTIFNSIWFNIVTMAGVGYGDITPISFSGKVFAILSIIMGIFFVSIFTAAMSALYVEKPEKETRNKIKKYILHLEEENKTLKKDISELKEDIVELNDKIDYLIEHNKKEK